MRYDPVTNRFSPARVRCPMGVWSKDRKHYVQCKNGPNCNANHHKPDVVRELRSVSLAETRIRNSVPKSERAFL